MRHYISSVRIGQLRSMLKGRGMIRVYTDNGSKVVTEVVRRDGGGLVMKCRGFGWLEWEPGWSFHEIIEGDRTNG